VPENPVTIGPYRCGRGQPLLVIAGPCVIEDEPGTLATAEELAAMARRLELPLVFKASFDKANRTSVQSFRGPGLEKGLEILARINRTTGLPVTTDIHLPEQAQPAAEVCQLLQIPAFLCRQTDLLLAAGRTGRPVHVKKGQFLAPADMRRWANGALFSAMVGWSTIFGPFPRCRPWACPWSSMPPTACRSRAHAGPARVAVGADAVFLETHPEPDRALSDGPNMVPLDRLPQLLERLLAIRRVVEGFA